MTESAPRVRVQRRAGTRRARTEVTAEIDAQTLLGEALVRSLVRAQLRLALAVLLMLAATLGAVPMLLATVPGLGEAHLLGVPVVWWLLGGGAYPLLWGLGWYYVRHAERNEATFLDLLDRS